MYYNGPIEAKNNIYGVGYEADGFEENDILETSKQKSNRISMDPYEEDSGFNNIEFNDEEVEAIINPSKDNKKKSQNFESDFKIPYKEFILDGTLEIKSSTYTLPEVPTDYNIFLDNKTQTPNDVSSHNTRMNPEKRSTLLGERKFLSKAPLGQLLEKSNKFMKPKEEIFSDGDIVIELPFSRTSEKMERFKAFILEKKFQKLSGSTSTNVLRIFT